MKPFLKGSLDVRRYSLSGNDKLLVFPYLNRDGKSTLIDQTTYAKDYPLTWEYLVSNKARLAKRAKGRLGNEWFGYVYKKNHLRFEQPKILAPAIASGACFAWDGAGKYYFVGSGGGGGGGYGIVLNSDIEYSAFYVLGMLNSKLSTFWLKRTSSLFRGGYIALNRQYIENIPFPRPDLADMKVRKTHDKLAELVDQMLALNEKLASAKSGHNRTLLERQIATTDQQIDELVYQLYGLTEEEIAIVEAAK